MREDTIRDPVTFADSVERQRARDGAPEVNFYQDALKASQEFRREYKERMNVVKWNEMPMERSADGLIKHIINERMNTKECCIDIYMQFIAANEATGTSRHLTEEVAFVIEGTGHDLHYDVHFDCKDEFVWQWDTKPKTFEWGPAISSTSRPTWRISASTPPTSRRAWWCAPAAS